MVHIVFTWKPLPWEAEPARGMRSAAWSVLPRQGDTLKLNLNAKSGMSPRTVVFEVGRTHWNEFGQDVTIELLNGLLVVPGYDPNPPELSEREVG